MPGFLEATSPGAGRGLSPVAAVAVVAASAAATALLGRRNSPGPAHPAIDRWYRKLRKPPFTPPDPAFGAVWPAVEAALAYGGYRLAPEAARSRAGRGPRPLAPQHRHDRHDRRVDRAVFPAAPAGRGRGGGRGDAGERGRLRRGRRGGGQESRRGGRPFVAWLGFATLLAEEVWRRNPPRGDRHG